jgi:hypothetical protein
MYWIIILLLLLGSISSLFIYKKYGRNKKIKQQ